MDAPREFFAKLDRLVVLYLAPPVLRLFRYLDAVERGRRRRFGEVVWEQIVARVPVGNVDNVARDVMTYRRAAAENTTTGL